MTSKLAHYTAEYTLENPKITAKCSHHFHLGCIYEWMERSESCPICGKVYTTQLLLSASVLELFCCNFCFWHVCVILCQFMWISRG